MKKKTPRRKSWVGHAVDAAALAAVAVGVVASASPSAAGSPAEIPPRRWPEILRRTAADFGKDNIAIIAGGVTFHVLLALFPAMAAFVSIYGLVADVSQAPAQLHALSAMLPPAMVNLVGAQMQRLAHARTGGLSLALIFGVLISLWSANGAMRAVMVALNAAYEVKETRGFFRQTLVSLTFTFGLIFFAMVAFAALAAGTVAAAFVGPAAATAVNLARWPLLIVAFAVGLSVLYRYGPATPRTSWRWVTWGSVAATALWLIMSLAFSFYVARFGQFDRIYGPLGAAVGLMVWVWLSAIVVLAGAELNSEVEYRAKVR